MAQMIKIARVEVKEGDNAKGHWINHIITGDDNSKVSTFDHSASSLKVGDTIEAEIELKGKYANLKSFKVIESAPPPAEGAPASKLAPAPQAVGMITKEIGDNMRAGILTELFGSKISDNLVQWYRQQVLNITQLEAFMPTKSTREAVSEPSDSPAPKEEKKLAYDRAKVAEDLAQLENTVKGWDKPNLLSFMKTMYSVEAPTVLEAVDKLDQGKLNHFLARIREAL